MRLENRIAIVTGARRGIGRAVALALAKEGASVVVSDISREDCQKVVTEIEGLGRRGLALKCDVTSKAEVEDMVRGTIAAFGRIDILVNNAGIQPRKPFLELTEEEWDTTLNVNLKGQFLCAQAAAKEMVKNKWGRIINMASISSGGSHLALPLSAHYTSSKGGVIGLTKAMALELTPHGINVNAICPGITETDMTKGVSNDRLLKIMSRVLKGRRAKPEEIANLAVFLASEESEYITGAAIVIDGGWLTT